MIIASPEWNSTPVDVNCRRRPSSEARRSDNVPYDHRLSSFNGNKRTVDVFQRVAQAQGYWNDYDYAS